MQMDIYVSAAIMRIFGNGVWSAFVYVCVCVRAVAECVVWYLCYTV